MKLRYVGTEALLLGFFAEGALSSFQQSWQITFNALNHPLDGLTREFPLADWEPEAAIELKTRAFTIVGKSITEVVTRWFAVKATFDDYFDVEILSIK